MLRVCHKFSTSLAFLLIIVLAWHFFLSTLDFFYSVANKHISWTGGNIRGMIQKPPAQMKKMTSQAQTTQAALLVTDDFATAPGVLPVTVFCHGFFFNRARMVKTLWHHDLRGNKAVCVDLLYVIKAYSFSVSGRADAHFQRIWEGDLSNITFLTQY